VIGSLLILGFTLSLDNFRTAVALGGLRLGWRQSAQVALVFGLCDGLAPLVGILIGNVWSNAIGSTAEYVGAIGLGLYGLYLVVKAWRTEAPDEMERPWAVFGLVVPLSADNIVAGTSLGLLGLSPWVVAPLFGFITALMAFVGLQVGRAAAGVVRIRSDLLTGVTLLLMATVMVGTGL
jgi:putative Mn2+ efflux pump MntP